MTPTAGEMIMLSEPDQMFLQGKALEEIWGLKLQSGLTNEENRTSAGRLLLT